MSKISDYRSSKLLIAGALILLITLAFLTKHKHIFHAYGSSVDPLLATMGPSAIILCLGAFLLWYRHQ